MQNQLWRLAQPNPKAGNPNTKHNVNCPATGSWLKFPSLASEQLISHIFLDKAQLPLLAQCPSGLRGVIRTCFFTSLMHCMRWFKSSLRRKYSFFLPFFAVLVNRYHRVKTQWTLCYTQTFLFEILEGCFGSGCYGTELVPL
jgi:hypothetical protein